MHRVLLKASRGCVWLLSRLSVQVQMYLLKMYAIESGQSWCLDYGLYSAAVCYNIVKGSGCFWIFCLLYGSWNNIVCTLWDSRCCSLTCCLIKLVFISVLDFGEFSAEFTLKGLFFSMFVNMCIKILFPNSTTRLLKTIEILQCGGLARSYLCGGWFLGIQRIR